jgi:hypothetical protein
MEEEEEGFSAVTVDDPSKPGGDSERSFKVPLRGCSVSLPLPRLRPSFGDSLSGLFSDRRLLLLEFIAAKVATRCRLLMGEAWMALVRIRTKSSPPLHDLDTLGRRPDGPGLGGALFIVLIISTVMGELDTLSTPRLPGGGLDIITAALFFRMTKIGFCCSTVFSTGFLHSYRRVRAK